MEKPKILIADQNPHFLEKSGQILQDGGYEMIPVADGLEAKIGLVSSGAKGILAHIDLPRLDGISLCRYVKEEFDITLPFIIMSPEKEENIKKAYEAGADNIVFRPIKRTELLYCVRSIIRLRDLLLENQKLTLGGEMGGSTSTLLQGSNVSQFQFFKAFLSVEIKRARRYGFPLSLLLVSLDIPDKIEMRYGSQVLRQLLVGLGKAIKKSVRDIDIPVTLKDETILILMPHTDVEGAQVVAERVKGRIKRSVYKDGTVVIKPTISIGLTKFIPESDEEFAPVMKRATIALNKAKEQGGNLVLIEV